MATTLRSTRLLVALAALVAPSIQARDLTFEDRVAAQEAIERVYYSHQIGATKSFEQALPRAVLAARVEKYLKQSAALEVYWHTPVTAEMLQAEMERQARQSRMPERLRELYAALGDDPFLVRECLARPALVDRLMRNLFGFDGQVHTAAKEEAERLRQGLLRYGSDAFSADSRRREVEIVEVEEEARPEPQGKVARLELPPDEYTHRRSLAPQRPGEVGPLREERESFVIDVVLEEHPASARIASFTVAKRSWDSWWQETATAIHGESVGCAGGDGPLPVLQFKTLEQGSEERSGLPGAGPASACPDDTWDNGSLDTPEPRYGHSAVWTGSEMVVWGGAVMPGGPVVNSGGRYDPATDSWTSTSVVGAPSPRSGHAAVWTGSLMVVWGGGGGLATGARYDPGTDSWTPMSIVGAPLGSGSAAVWTGSLMVVWGGYKDGFLNTGGRYDPGTDTWAPTSTVGAPAPPYSFTAVWTGSRMVVWGNEPFGPGDFLMTGGRYDPATDSWTPISTVGAPAPRSGHSAVWTGSRMVVWGGYDYDGVDLNTGSRYDPTTDSWLPTSILGAPEGRHYHTAVWTGSRMVVWGGHRSPPASPSAVNSGGRYDPATNTWAPMTTTDAPSGRYGHTAVWTGGLMVVWGGGGSLPVGVGGRYDPVTNSWAPVVTGDGPSARSQPTAVWTGSEMVVWGGLDDFGSALNTGSRYDPATDTWSPTASTLAPSERAGHTAVWTGSEMVVWGGYLTLGSWYPIDTGGRYDPRTDSWEPTSTVGGPERRRYHTAVWTGSEMVVWGGIGQSIFKTGGRYDPIADTWILTSTTGAPFSRFHHTAVWTGNVMVVWGGQDSFYTFSDGGRYDPGTDSWEPTSTVGAPSGRYSHTAVWTGSVMVVWGGFAPNTGGRYDPVTNSWTPTSTVDAPAARYGHTAVWTGNVMVVWGGNGADLFNTGAMYNPATNAWTPTSLVGAPSPRFEHTAAWTGSEMLVWGGRVGVASLNSGGRYSLGQSSDGDGDGLVCATDCNDTDAGVHAIPAEVTGLGFAADGETLEWNSAIPEAGSATVHDVLTGVVTELPVGSGAAETCFETTALNSTVVSEVPSSGSVAWYLVRGRNLCGDGTYGSASDGTPRASDACP